MSPLNENKTAVAQSRAEGASSMDGLEDGERIGNTVWYDGRHPNQCNRIENEIMGEICREHPGIAEFFKSSSGKSNPV